MHRDPGTPPLYSIGQFAQLSRINAKTLRYYDDEDVLKPAAVDETTGYRYYTPEQLPPARNLHRLRSVQMPLAALREFMHDPTQDCQRRLHAQHLERLQNDVELLSTRLRTLERRLTYPWQDQPYEVTVEQYPTAPFVFLPHHVTLARIEEAREQAFMKVWAHLARHRVAPVGPPTCFFPPRPADPARQKLHDEQQIRQVYAGFEVAEPVPSEGQIVSGWTPGGTWYTTRHRGLHDYLGCMGPIDFFMGQRLRGDGLAIQRGHGDFIVAEIYHTGPWDTADLTQLVTEVRWLCRVETAGSVVLEG